MKQLLILSLYRKDDVAIFDLAEDAPIIQYEKIHFDFGLARQVVDRLSKIIESTHSRLQDLSLHEESLKTDNELIKLGKIIFEQFLPTGVQDVLRKTKAHGLIFRIDESFLDIPWEMAHDGKDFLSNRFHIGRQIITSRTFKKPQQNKLPSNNKKKKIIIICDPDGTLPQARAEGEQLLELLDRHTHLYAEILAGERATRFRVLKALEDFDIVHYAGHSVFSPDTPDQNGWLLQDGPVTFQMISRISRPPVLVFSNSCSSAAAGSPETDACQVHDSCLNSSTNCMSNLGLGGNFLLAGVKNFIGSFWIIHDESSASFAVRFYQQLASGCSLGGSLCYAKRKCVSTYPDQRHIWASYIQYGNPDDKLIIINRDGTPKKIKSSGETAPRRPALPEKNTWIIIFIICFCFLVFSLGLWKYLPKTLRHDGKVLKENSTIQEAYEYAVADYRKGLVNNAITTLEHLVQRKDNSSGLGSAYLAEIYYETGHAEKADRMLKAALDRFPENPMVHIVSAERFWAMGIQERAEHEYLEALKCKPLFPWQAARAANGLGVIALLTGRKPDAITYFASALQKDKNNSDALFNLAVMAYLNNNMHKAESLFRSGLKRSPDDEMGNIFLELIRARKSNHSFHQLNPSRPILGIGPFIISKGPLNRAGYDILLAEYSGHLFQLSKGSLSKTISPPYGPDYTSFRLGRLSGQKKLADYVKSANCQMAVFGEFGISASGAALRLKFIDVTSGRIHADKNFREIGMKKIQTITNDIKMIIGEASTANK